MLCFILIHISFDTHDNGGVVAGFELGGGVIDLHTIDAPNEPFFNMKLSLGGNTESTGKESLIYYGSRTDFTGFDDDTRDVPGAIRIAFDQGKQIMDGQKDQVLAALSGVRPIQDAQANPRPAATNLHMHPAAQPVQRDASL